jgi:hypothetical protein
VRAWRLRRHRLAERGGSIVDVASRLCGVHAQLASSAELTLLARMEELAPGAVDAALWEERTLVKTWAMRGTLHLFPARELGLWLGGLATYRHFRTPGWSRGFGLDEGELDAILTGVEASLDGRDLTREELAVAVAAHAGSPVLAEKMGGSWGSVIKPAAYRGDLIFAPGDGQKVRFTRPESWLGGAVEVVEGSAALAEITRRYLSVSGPATRDDFARWWATTPAAAERLLEAAGVEADVEGTTMWMTAEGAEEAARAGAPQGVRLVPAFDQYVVAATRHAGPLMPGDFRDRIYRPQGWLSPILLVGGRMDGVWRHERRGRRLLVSIEPFKRVTKAVRAEAEAEAERIAAYLGGELSLTWA